MEKKSILIVEDEKIAAIDLRDTLISFGYRIAGIAPSGERAIEMVNAETPDLILMDIHLSGQLSGIQAAEQILLNHAIPIIYVTAYADPELIERAKQTRPYGYIIKPYDERVIRTDIEIALYKFGLDQNFQREYADLKEWLLKKAEDLELADESLRKSEKKYRTLFENMLDGFAYCQMIYDDQGRPADWVYIDVNAAFERLTRLTNISGKRVLEVIPDIRELTPELFDTYGRVASTGIPEVFEIDFKPLKMWLKISVFSPEKGYFVAVFDDISERKRSEEALRMANKKLNLLSSITRHDIRNQLTALKAYIDLTGDSLENPTQLAEYLLREERVADNIERQISFTDDYQDMGVKSPVWQNVNEIASRAASTLALREVRVETNCPGLDIFVDPLFEKVFYNLIDNALRYGGPKMTLIRITSTESKRSLVIAVEDDGSGISPEDKKRLFERGFGKHTGLGLFLSREILSLTGITITETSEPGKGARFEMTVPKGTYRFTKN